MTDTGPVTTAASAPVPTPAKKQRGRESAGDMLRSLGLVMIIVVALWFFAQPPKSDAQKVRPVDPTQQVLDFTRTASGAPVPHTPPGFTSNVAVVDPDGLRIGYVTAAKQYAEIAETTGPSTAFVARQSAKGAVVGTVDVAGAPWQQLRSADGLVSLSKVFGRVTVVVGGLRASASLPELQILAATVR